MEAGVRIGCSIALFAVLSGCAEQDILKYQGRPAATALECKAAYEEAKRRPVAVDYSSSGAVIGSAIGKGIAEGMISSAYDTCLARVAALDPAEQRPFSPHPVPVATASAPRVAAPSPGTTLRGSRPQTEPYLSMWGRECVPGYGVYQEGLSCTGY